jgi:tetratricopeptide (TPR) repeat protein
MAFPSTISGKIEFACGLKEQGNAHFKEGSFSKALVCYGKVFAFTRGHPGATFEKQEAGGFDTSKMVGDDVQKITPEEQKRCIDLEIAVENNMATIFIKQKNGSKAVKHSERALVRDPSNWKAFLRLGEGKALLHDWEGSCKSLRMADELAPEANKATIRKELEKSVAQEKRERAAADAAQRKSMAGVFERMRSTP